LEGLIGFPHDSTQALKLKAHEIATLVVMISCLVDAFGGVWHLRTSCAHDCETATHTLRLKTYRTSTELAENKHLEVKCVHVCAFFEGTSMGVKEGEGARLSRHPVLGIRIQELKAFWSHEVVEECAASWSAVLPGSVRDK
jgi:hypothetical protein